MKKILINLLSEQRIQNLIAIKFFKPDHVVALTTIDYEYQVDIFENISNLPHEKIQIEAYRLSENLGVLGSVMERYKDSQLIINYTGGTKVMALSAILKVLLSSTNKVELAYVNSKDLKMESIIVDQDKSLNSKEDDLKININIDEYFSMMGEDLDRMDTSLSKAEMERQDLSYKLLSDVAFSKLFRMQKSFFGKGGIALKTHSLIIDNIDIYWDTKELRVKTPKKLFQYDHNDGGSYLTGSWLEELVFNKVEQSGKFDECVKNVRVNYKEQETFHNKNEIDVVVRKGFKTAFIECKAGNITQDHVYKLKSITNHYLGSFGIPALFSKFRPQPNIVEKCKDLGVQLFTGVDFKYLDFEIEKLLK